MRCKKQHDVIKEFNRGIFQLLVTARKRARQCQCCKEKLLTQVRQTLVNHSYAIRWHLKRRTETRNEVVNAVEFRVQPPKGMTNLVNTVTDKDIEEREISVG